MTHGRRSLDDWLRLQETVHGAGHRPGPASACAAWPQRLRAAAARRAQHHRGRHQRQGLHGRLPRRRSCARTGYTVGAFTSPHLLRYNERIRVDGAEASDAELVAAFEAIEAARGDITLTFFEYNALAAL